MVTTKKMGYHRVHALACGKQVEVTAVVLDSRFTRYCVSMLPTEHRQLLMLLAFHVAGLFMVAIPNTARKQIAVKYNMHYMMYFFASLAAGAFTTSNIAYVGSQPCNGQAAAKNLAATGARDMAALALRQRVSRHWGSHKQGQVVEAKALDHLLCVRVDLKRSHRWVKRRHLGHVLVLTLTLLLLELERDATNRAALDTPHKMGRETSDLVAKALRRHNGHLVDHLLVGVEVHRVKARVVLFDEDTSSALGSLRADATLQCC